MNTNENFYFESERYLIKTKHIVFVRIIIIFLITSVSFSGSGQVLSVNALLESFNNLRPIPEIISFSNLLEVNNSGGHLQGIQSIEPSNRKYFVLSGSSDSYAYCAVVKTGEKNEVISVNKLMDKPFKHAGGFQVFQHYLAIGIEDNDAKDKSKVCIYDISNPEKPVGKPIAVIERNGAPLRSTAGCVGITKYKEQILLAVGDWDTKNIDFYSCNYSDFSITSFEHFCSINTDTISRENLIGQEWLPYQNINLVSTIENELFLVGLGQNRKNENIADLYHLKPDETGKFILIKKAAKTFSCENEVSFKAGAGVVTDKKGNFGIVACGHNIFRDSCLNYFRINKTE